MTYNDYPFKEIIKAADNLIKQGLDVHQKFTCEKCGSRQTIEEANTFFTSGKCEECNHITDIQKNGCNYLTITRVSHTAKQEKMND